MRPAIFLRKGFHIVRLDAARALSRDVNLLGFVSGTRQPYTRFFTRPVSAAAWKLVLVLCCLHRSMSKGPATGSMRTVMQLWGDR